MINTRPEILEKVKELLASKVPLEASELKEESDLFDDAGADSLDMLEVKMDVESHYGISIPDEELEKWRTVADVVDYLELVLNPIGI